MTKRIIFAALILSIGCTLSFATPLTAEQKSKVEGQLKAMQALGGDPKIVALVKQYNAAPPAEGKGMTQEKWKSLKVLDATVKFFSNNELAKYLKTKRTEVMAELFVSLGDGTKAAFFAKTSNWSHKGSAKHDVPMTGKTWIGESALDESTGMVLVQIGFPVLDGGKPIGSIVIGLDMGKIK